MCRFRNRRGLTLIELTIATSIMAIMAGVLGGLAMSVQMQSRHSQGHGEAVQHARVVIDRLQRLMNEATANEQFPGFVAFSQTVSGNAYPDTIVIWHPAATAADPAGLPRWNELILICPDLNEPNVLLEITDPSDTNVVPALANTAVWAAEILAMRQSNLVERTELTDLVRTALAGSGGGQLRAAIRFDVLKRPDDTQFQEFDNGTRAWNQIDWVQGIYGAHTGLRQVWCRIEMQLIPGTGELNDAGGANAVTFFGSAAVYHEMRQ